MTGSTSLLAATILVTAMVVSAVDEAPLCQPAVDLKPRASSGATRRVPSTLTPNGELLRWAAADGDTLGLRLFVDLPGTYTMSLSAVHSPTGPVMSAKLWDDPLTRRGERCIALRSGSGPEILAVRFDSVSLGPGHHILELSCLEPGEFLLDCIALRRTGDLILSPAGNGNAGSPFLGVQMGGPKSGGVAITRTVDGSAADEAGLEAGDVLVAIGGEPMRTTGDVTDAILGHRPGDRIELALLRDGEPLEKVVTLGRRLDSDRGSSSRAAHVIEILDIGPGQVIADIGAGSGWLSEAIAKTVGADGLVYAVEIQEGHVRRLRHGSMANMVAVLSMADDVSLPANSLDTAMLHDVAAHVDEAGRPRFYASVASALKPQGRLVIFDPHGEARAMLDELRGYGFVPLGGEHEGDVDEWLQEGIVFRYAGAAAE